MLIKITTTAGRRLAPWVESFRNEAGQPRRRTLAPLEVGPGRARLGALGCMGRRRKAG